MKWIYIFKGLTIGALLVLSACKQDDIIINEPDMRKISIEGPAARFNLTVYDFIDDLAEEDIFVAEDGVLYFQYREPIFINWESLVTLRDVNERWVFGWQDLASPLKNASVEPAFSQRVVLSHQDDVRYDKVTLQEGMLDLSFEVPPGFVGTLTVEIPQATSSDGTVLSVEFDVDAFGGATSPQLPLSLADYQIIFGNSDVEPYNSHIDLNVYQDLTLAGLPTSTDLVLNFSLTDLKQASAYGYFGDQTAVREDAELKLGVLDELDDLVGNIELEDFDLDIEIHNSIGVPFYVEAYNIRFFQKDSETPDLLMIDNENRAVIDYIPSALETEPITPGRTDFSVEGNNSNLIEIGNSFPVRLMVDLMSRSNPPAPEGVEAEKDNFMLMVEELQADLVIKLPFWFSATDYARTDTIEFDFLDIIDGSEEEVDHIDVAKIFFDFESTFPLNIIGTAWVIDAQGEKIDDLLKEDTFLIQSGTSTSPGNSTFEIGLTSQQIARFKDRDVKEIVMAYSLSTGGADRQPVKIKQDAGIQALVSFDFSGNIPQ
ncbi:MAG: hypothetical protein LC643_05860 [Bacteroidales bacterium]|nr:hypothetical protein [Bacteroidales bacterium]